MARLLQQYREKIVPDLMSKFSYKSVMEVPRITKITLNMGVSEAVADRKVLDNASGDLVKIAGQKVVVTFFVVILDFDIFYGDILIAFHHRHARFRFGFFFLSVLVLVLAGRRDFQRRLDHGRGFFFLVL